MKVVFLIEAGHGADNYTKNGKFSPPVAGLGIENDPTIFVGRFREGNFNRLIAAELVKRLKALGYEAHLIVPEKEDISLVERARRVNTYCVKYGKQNCLLLSIHANTAGNAAVWKDAKGWMSIVDDFGSAKAKDFADMLFDTVKAAGLKTRQPLPSRKWYYYRECIGKQARLYILSRTACPAVLTENFFYTDRDEVQFLASPAGREIIVQYHLKACVEYAKKYN